MAYIVQASQGDHQVVDRWIEFVKGERPWEDLNTDALSTEELDKAKAQALRECQSMEDMEEL